MGILSRESLEKLGEKLVRFQHVITILGIVLPIVLFTALSFPEINESTTISEKALLPGLVDETWQNYGEFATHLKSLTAMQSETSTKKLAEYVYEELSKIGLETYRQQFRSNITKILGTNVFGFIRASRSTPGGAMIVVIKLAPNQKEAISVALSIAKHSKSKSYWARDIIFLFVDGRDPNTATLAWLQAYNGADTGRYLWAESLSAHSGIIIGGMVLDLSVSHFTHFQIQYTGVNGLLPNLDVFNLFVRLCEKHDIKVQIQDSSFQNRNDHISTIWRGVFSQAFNELEGIHSVLNHYRIHSVTLRALPDKQPHKRVRDMDSAALILEGGLRSYNNMLEKFHRGYFFYYLLGPNRFISIAYYFPIISIHLLVLLLHQFNGWSGVSEFKFQCSTWAQANVMAVFMYFAHILIYNQYLQTGSLVHSQFAYWSDEQIAVFVIAINMFWPWIAAAKIKSPSERSTIRYIHYGVLTVILLSIGLLNPSIGIYIGTYFLLSSFITSVIPWNNLVTRLIYNLIMNPITFHILVIFLASALGYWPRKFYVEDLLRPSKIAAITLNEGKRLLRSHLQHNSFNFLLFMLVSQQAHAIFISLIGRK